MNSPDVSIENILRPLLDKEGLNFIDLIEVSPESSDLPRQFCERVSSHSEYSYYLIKLKKKRSEIVMDPTPLPAYGDVYQATGQLNILFLEENARLLIQAREFHLAKNIYKAILQSKDKPAKALLGYGKCLDGEGSTLDAQAYYEESIAYEPTVDACEALIQNLFRQKKDQYACEVIERSLKFSHLGAKSRFTFYQALGNGYFRLNRFEPSKQSFLQALNYEPSSDGVRASLGAVYLCSGQIQDAERSFQDAVSTNPANEEALFGLALSQYALNKFVPALESFRKTLVINSRHTLALLYFSRLSFYTKNILEIEGPVQRYMESGPIHPSLMVLQAAVKLKAGKVEEANHIFQQLERIKPGYMDGKVVLKLLSRRTDCGERAIT